MKNARHRNLKRALMCGLLSLSMILTPLSPALVNFSFASTDSDAVAELATSSDATKAESGSPNISELLGFKKNNDTKELGVIDSENPEISDATISNALRAAVPGNITLETFASSLVYGTNSSDNTWLEHDSLSSSSYKSGHKFVYRVAYSFSGVDKIPENYINITIPKSTLVNRAGNPDDRYEMSLPTEMDVKGGDIDSDIEFTYREDGNNIIVYNFKELPAGYSGYFEVAYKTADSTLEYEDTKEMNPFIASIEAGSQTKEADPIKVKIDTNAKISTAKSYYPVLHTTWEPSWGTPPENADDKLYLSWDIISTINNTQPYNFNIKASVESTNNKMKIEAYKFHGQRYFSTANEVKNQTINRERNDVVIASVNKADYADLEHWDAKLKADLTLTPIDGHKPNSTYSVNNRFSYNKPRFKFPNGFFETHKRGNRDYYYYWSGSTKQYTRYDLEQFNGYDNNLKTLDVYDSLKYYTYIGAHPYAWTLEDGADKLNPASYGKKKVTYELKDDVVRLGAGSDDPSNYITLTDKDCTLDKIDWSINASDSVFDEVTQQFKSSPVQWGNDENVEFYVAKDDNNYVLVGKYNLKTSSATDINLDIISELNGSVIRFNGTEGMGYSKFMIKTTNAHYSTYIYTYPSYKLHSTDTVMNKLKGVASTVLENHAIGRLYSSNGTEIVNMEQKANIYNRVSQKTVSLSKGVISTSNNPKRRKFTITWGVDLAERIIKGKDGKWEYIPQQSGVFYDLLPSGSNIDMKSIVVRDNNFGRIDNFSVETKYNFKNSGRTLLIIKISDQADAYTVMYDTVYSWTSIKDWGNKVYNPVAYETGNPNIYTGTVDNGGLYDSKGKKLKAIKEHDLLSGISDTVSNDYKSLQNRMIYSENTYDIRALTSASTGLTKKVKGYKDNSYSYNSETTLGADYSYEVRFQNSLGEAKDLVLYDSVENFETPDGKTSDWNGTIDSVDTSNLDAKNANYSISTTTDVLDNDNMTKEALESLDWHPGIIDGARSIRLDVKHTKNNTDFILGSSESLSFKIFMKTPKDAVASGNGLPKAYNNIYLSSSIRGNSSDSWVSSFVHQDYTTIAYKIARDLNLEKSDSTKPSKKVRGAEFRLFGRSEYGNDFDISLKTDYTGKLSIPSIEFGKYTLQEVSTNPDYLLDKTVHNLEVTKEGKLIIDGKDYTDKIYSITNNPRIQGDLEFTKKDFSNARVGGVTFQLSGKSDYNNDISEIATSDKDTGKVRFENIEKGTYTLREISLDDEASEKVVLSSRAFKVICDDTGTLRILGVLNGDKLEENSDWLTYERRNGLYDNSGKKILPSELDLSAYEQVILNEKRYYEFPVRKVDIDNEVIDLANAEFSLKGTSDLGTETYKTAKTGKSGERAVFTGIEKGTYILQETVAPHDVDADGHAGGTRNYALDNTKHIVEIDDHARIKVDGVDYDNVRVFTAKNKVLNDKQIVVTKIWDDGSNNENRPNPVIHLSTNDPRGKTITVSIDNSEHYVYMYKDSEGMFYEPADWVILTIKYKLYKENGKTKIECLEPEKVKDLRIVPVNKYEKYVGLGTDQKNIKSVLEGFQNLYHPEVSKGVVLQEDITVYPLVKKFEAYFDSRAAFIKGVDDIYKDAVGWGHDNNAHSLADLPADRIEIQDKTKSDYPIYLYNRTITDDPDGYNGKWALWWSQSPVVYWKTSNRLRVQRINRGSSANRIMYRHGDFTYKTEASFKCIDLIKINFSKTESLNEMFADFVNLKTIRNMDKLSSSKPKYLVDMFKNCKSLEKIVLPLFSNYNSGYYVYLVGTGNMFKGCSSLRSLDISNLKTYHTENMISMFAGCSSLKSLDLSKFDISKVTTMDSMFSGCSSLTNIYVNYEWVIYSKHENTPIFQGCVNLPHFDPSQITFKKAYYERDGLGYLTYKEYTHEAPNNKSRASSRYAPQPSAVNTATSLEKPTNILASLMYGISSVASKASAFIANKASEIITDKIYKNNTNSSLMISTYSNATRLNDTSITNADLLSTSSNAVSNAVSNATSNASLLARAPQNDRIDLSSNDITPVKDGNTWTYTFNVADTTLNYYLYEDAISGYITPEPQELKGVTQATLVNKKDIKKGTLKLVKEIDTRVTQENQEGVLVGEKFKFNISLSGKHISGTQVFGDTVFKDGKAQVVMTYTKADSDNQKTILSRTFTDIPDGTTYTISEEPNETYEVHYNNESGTISADTTSEARVINGLNLFPERNISITVRKFIGNYNDLSRSIQDNISRMSNKEGFKVSVMLSGLKPNSTYFGFKNILDNYNTDIPIVFNYSSDSQGNATINETVNMKWQFKLVVPENATYNIVELPSQDYRSSVKVSTGSDPTSLTEQFSRRNVNQNTSISTGENTADADVYVDFTNDFVPKQDLYISACKETSGFSSKRLDVDKEYQIHLEISNLKPDTILESDIGNLRADDNGNIYRDFAIKAGQFIKITNIPVNAKVVAAELRNTDIARYKAGDLDINYTEDVLSQRKLIRTDTDMVGNETGSNYNKEPLKDLKTQELTIRQNVDAAISFINYSEVSTVNVDFNKVERDQNKFKDPVVTDFTGFELEDILNVKNLDGAEYDLYTESGVFIQHIEINSKTIDELEKQIEAITALLKEQRNQEEFRRLISLIQVESEKSTVKDLAAGNYYLIETKSPVGYKKNKDKINITIEKDTTSVVLTDEKLPIPYDIVPTGSSSALLMISLLSILLGLGLALRKKQQS